MNGLASNIAAVRRRINEAAAACGRDGAGIALLAVCKAQPPAAVAAALAAGVGRFGENYLQEAPAHLAAARAAEWHFIGRLQSNKTAEVARRFAWVQSVDRARIAARLAHQRPADAPPLQVCIQVDVDDEPAKGGVDAAGALALAATVAGLDRLVLRGVMAIPRPRDDAHGQRRAFAAVRAVYERLRDAHPGVDTLSMGMSGDLEAAVAEGSTLVRVGSAIFGPRA